MANLPLTGSQYWGAALNNYLRQLDGEINDLKIQLKNFTVAASYSGSGFTEDGYGFSRVAVEGATYDQDFGGIFLIEEDDMFNFDGTVIFNRINKGTTSTIRVDKKQNKKIAFSTGASTNEQINVGILTYEEKTGYAHSFRRKSLKETFTEDGYYPVYILLQDDQIAVDVNVNKDFIFNEDFIMFGLLKRVTINSVTQFFFAQKADSAFKSLYDTRKGNVQAFASIVNPAKDGVSSSQGLFAYSEAGLNVLLNSSIVDYQLNGIGQHRDESVEDDKDFKLQTDFKRFNGGEYRHCYIIDQTNGSRNEIFESLKTADLVLTSEPKTEFPVQYLYGIYINAFGDLLIERSGNLPTGTNSASTAAKDADSNNNYVLYNYIQSFTWDLNTDSNFKASTPVLLGSFYYFDNAWHYSQATSNGLSPSYMTNSSVENTSYVYWPDVTYLSYLNKTENITNVMSYKFKLTNNESDSKTHLNYLNIDASYKGGVSDVEDKNNNYNILTTSRDFSSVSKSTEDGRMSGLNLGALTIESKSKSDIQPVKVIKDGSLEIPSKLNVTGLTTTEDTNIKGSLTLDSGKTFFVNRTISQIYGLKGASENKEGIKININNTAGIVLTNEKTAENDIIIDKDFNILGQNNLTLKCNQTLTINSKSMKIVLDENSPLEINNSIAFIGDKFAATSDRRCKHNIKSLNKDLCLEAVKAIDAKSFIYNKSNQESIGLIAQDIETYLSDYKDSLVAITETEDFKDQRAVAETKMTFILWQAVRKIIDLMEV